LKQLVGVHEIQQAGRPIKGDFDAMPFNTVPSTIPK
jgi:hypothetical protein